MTIDVIPNMLKWIFKIRIKKVFYLFIFISNFGFANHITDNVLPKIRNHKFKEVEKILKSLDDNKLLIKELSFYNQLVSNYGVYKDTVNIRFIKKDYNEPLLKSLYKLNLGLYKILYEYGEETKAFQELNESLEIALVLKNKPLICEILKTILIYYDRLFYLYDDSFEHYLEFYKNNTYDILEERIYASIKIRLILFDSDYNLSNKDLEKLDYIINNIKNKYYKATTLLTQAYYYENKNKSYTKSSKGYFKAYQILSSNENGLFIERTYAAKINSAISLYKLGKYNEAIILLKNTRSMYKGKSIDWVRNFKHIWLSRAYKDIGKEDSAYYHLNESRKIRNKFNQKKHDEQVSKLIIKHEVKKISLNNKSLKTKMNTILPILAIITLLLGVVFILYKKYYKKSEILEEEKSETIKKIDELKQIVIKNHIILKDKTKVYIVDLLYIKSDDHYLKVFLSNGKNHFVRGKLTKIIEELPPNFIRCHRSYVVNRNFIKQINNTNIILVDKTELPLSRSYKDKL